MEKIALQGKAKIRDLRADDWEFVRSCDESLRWGFSQDGPQFLFSTSHSAFISEFRQKPIGMVFGFKWGNDVGWIGLLVVKQEFRRQGIGRALLIRQVEELSNAKCSTIGLDAVPDMIQFYKSEGFFPAQRSLRLNRPWKTGKLHKSVSLAKKDDLSTLVTLDNDLTNLDRTRLLKSTLKCFPGKILIYTSKNTIAGYMAYRHRPDLLQVGPWMTRSPEVAEDMLQHLLHSLDLEAKMIRVGALEGSTAIKILKKLGFIVVFSSQRMYWGTTPQFPADSFVCIGDPAWS
ncbi:MAG: GNAT family N-acetyltransferase [Candidatus Heimdallarchaeota archaeon]